MSLHITSKSDDTVSVTSAPLSWYAVRTRSNFEKIVYSSLCARGYESYLPLYRTRTRRSKNAELVLFPGYVFCRVDLSRQLSSLAGQGILTTLGVVSILGFGNVYVPIPEHEIDAVRRVADSGMASLPWPYLAVGNRVRINRGALAGLEGILLVVKNAYRVLISVDLLQRSVAVEIDRDSIEPSHRS